MNHLIRTFGDEETRQLFQRVSVPRFQAFEHVAQRKLRLLHRAKTLHDLAGTGLSLEALKRTRKGQHSIRINRQYRVCFVWKDGNAYDVAIADYH